MAAGRPSRHQSHVSLAASHEVLQSLRLRWPRVLGHLRSDPIRRHDDPAGLARAGRGADHRSAARPGATGVVPDDPDNPEPACFPGEKADNATDQGWDSVILTGRHVAGGASADDPPNCGSAPSLPTSRSSPCARRTRRCTSCSLRLRTSRFRTRPPSSPTSVTSASRSIHGYFRRVGVRPGARHRSRQQSERNRPDQHPRDDGRGLRHRLRRSHGARGRGSSGEIRTRRPRSG
jgi:hypothetical protein